MIVVDTNIIAYFWLRGDQTTRVEKLLVKDPYWIVPSQWRPEFRNVLATSIREGLVEVERAIEIFEEAENSLQEREFNVPTDKILRLVVSSHCTAYDCEFVVLAQEKETFLVTEDRKLLQSFPQLAISVEQFLKR